MTYHINYIVSISFSCVTNHFKIQFLKQHSCIISYESVYSLDSFADVSHLNWACLDICGLLAGHLGLVDLGQVHTYAWQWKLHKSGAYGSDMIIVSPQTTGYPRFLHRWEGEHYFKSTKKRQIPMLKHFSSFCLCPSCYFSISQSNLHSNTQNHYGRQLRAEILGQVNKCNNLRALLCLQIVFIFPTKIHHTKVYLAKRQTGMERESV